MSHITENMFGSLFILRGRVDFRKHHLACSFMLELSESAPREGGLWLDQSLWPVHVFAHMCKPCSPLLFVINKPDTLASICYLFLSWFMAQVMAKKNVVHLAPFV